MRTLSVGRSRSVLPAVLASALLGVPLLTACENGGRAPTREEYSVTYGVQATTNNVVLRNLLLTTPAGDGMSGSTSLSLAGLVNNNTSAADTLTGVTAQTGRGQIGFHASSSGGSASGSSGASASGAASTSAAPSASAAASASGAASASASAGDTGNPTPTASAPSVSPSPPPVPISASLAPGDPIDLGAGGLGLGVTGLPSKVLPGTVVNVTFTFQNSGTVTVAVPVYTPSQLAPNPSQSPVTFPNPEVPQGYNAGEFDLESAPPSS